MSSTHHRINIVVDEKLVQEALSLSKIKTKRDLIHTALKEFVAMRKKPDIRDLRGMGGLYAGYDYKALRKNSKHNF